MRFLPTFRNFGEKGVMRLASNVSVSETVVRHPAATDGNVAHFSVEHGQGRRRMFDEYLQPFLALAQLLFNLLALENVLDDGNEVVRRTVRLAHHGNGQVDPLDGAVLATVAFLHQEGINLSRQYPPHRSQILLQIVRMGDVDESLCHQLIPGVTDDVAQPLVDLQPAAVRSDAGNADRGVLEDGSEPRLAIAQRLDVRQIFSQALHLVVTPPAEFPGGGFIRAMKERLSKRLVLAQHRFQIRLELQFRVTLCPEMLGANVGQEEHQLFITFWAEQPEQFTQPRRGLAGLKKHYGARDAKTAAQIGVEVGPISERRGRPFQRAQVTWQFLFVRHRLLEQRQRPLNGERGRAGVAGHTTISDQERAVARHTVARFAKAREPCEEPLLEMRGHRIVEVSELGLPK